MRACLCSLSVLAGPAVPPEVLATWYTDEAKLSAQDLKEFEAPKFRVGFIPVVPPPRRFCFPQEY